MYWQLYDEIKRLVLEGVIPSGTTMPSPRLVAEEYRCSRHTVSSAYEYLTAEGILEARHGVGTFVAAQPGLPRGKAETSASQATPHLLTPSRFAEVLRQYGVDRDEEDPLQKFGDPDADAFPWALWAKMYAKVWGTPDTSLLKLVTMQGHEGLRRAICDFAHRTRGIRATADHVIITSGTTQSLDLLIRVLLNPGDRMWLEDPGRTKAAALVRAQGLTPVCVPVDEDGIRVDMAVHSAPDAKAALITASHHYPTGATLSLERRHKLLSWADQTGGWIFEDDYDGEILADGNPILPMYSLGANERVVYMGTFSKSISPQLRIGYLICHPDLVKLLLKFRSYVEYFPALHMQPVLADFIAQGHLETHIRKMRRIYRERQTIFTEEIACHGSDQFALPPHSPTLFQPLSIREPACPRMDRELMRRAQLYGIPAYALSSFYLAAPAQQGIVIGTGRIDSARGKDAAKDLIQAARELRNAQST